VGRGSSASDDEASAEGGGVVLDVGGGPGGGGPTGEEREGEEGKEQPTGWDAEREFEETPEYRRVFGEAMERERDVVVEQALVGKLKLAKVKGVGKEDLEKEKSLRLELGQSKGKGLQFLRDLDLRLEESLIRGQDKPARELTLQETRLAFRVRRRAQNIAHFQLRKRKGREAGAQYRVGADGRRVALNGKEKEMK